MKQMQICLSSIISRLKAHASWTGQKVLKSWLAKQKKKTDQEIVDDTDNVAELLFKLDIEMWHAVRKQKKQGELLVAVAEDQTLKNQWN